MASKKLSKPDEAGAREYSGEQGAELAENWIEKQSEAPIPGPSPVSTQGKGAERGNKWPVGKWGYRK